MSANHKENFLIDSFSTCTTPEAVYHTLISWGKNLAPFDPLWKTRENQVIGCQSLMYLHTTMREGKIYFHAYSEALISAGLAALLIYYYQEESPEKVLQQAPLFLEKLGIPQSLTPSRANGLASLYTQMKKAALHYLVTQKAQLS